MNNAILAARYIQVWYRAVPIIRYLALGSCLGGKRAASSLSGPEQLYDFNDFWPLKTNVMLKARGLYGGRLIRFDGALRAIAVWLHGNRERRLNEQLRADPETACH